MERGSLYREFLLSGAVVALVAVALLVALLATIRTPLDPGSVPPAAATVETLATETGPEPPEAHVPLASAPASRRPVPSRAGVAAPAAPETSLPPPPATSVVLRGRVRTPEDRPVVGATIRVRLNGSFAGETTSGSDGEFEVPLASNGPIEVEARHPEHARATTRRGAVPPHPIDIVLRPGGTLTGRVLDDWTGEPVPSAYVRIGNGTGDSRDARAVDRSTTADADGRWTLDGLSPGTYTVAASARGYSAAAAPPVDVAVGTSNPEVVIRIPKVSTVSGRVVDDATGDPVSAAVVSFDPPYPAGTRRATSDGDGRFTLEVSPGRITIQARRSGFVTRWVSGLNLRPGETLEGVEVRLQKAQVGTSSPDEGGTADDTPASRRLAEIHGLEPGHGPVQYAGIGARLKAGREGPVVLDAAPGSPAESTGLVAGDVILEVDGVPLAGKSLREATEMIKGKEGEAVRLKVRGSDGRIRHVTPVRKLLRM